MTKCECYSQNGSKSWCYGTREVEECSCGGDVSKCDFYPEKRKQKTAAEKRLIDANAMREDWLENGENEFVYDTNAVIENIDEQPTVDAVEVVFCDECENHGNCYPETIFRFARVEKPFCCVGKRKTNTNCGAKMDGDVNGY